MNNYTITNPSDIFSLIMNVYGTLEESIQFVADNTALIPCLDANISTFAGQVVAYDPALVVTSLPPTTVLATPVASVTEYTWIGREGQNIFDVCIQTYGVLDNQIKLLNDNNIDFLTEVFEQQYNYDSTLIANSTIWNRSTGMGVIFSTGDISTINGPGEGGGSFDNSFDSLSFDVNE